VSAEGLLQTVDARRILRFSPRDGVRLELLDSIRETARSGETSGVQKCPVASRGSIPLASHRPTRSCQSGGGHSMNLSLRRVAARTRGTDTGLIGCGCDLS